MSVSSLLPRSLSCSKDNRGVLMGKPRIHLFLLFALVGLPVVQSFPAVAQSGKTLSIAIVGAPEEPRFSEVVTGLRAGLRELGYVPQSLVIHEAKIARAEEMKAGSLFEALLRKNAQVFFLIGSRLLKPLREVSKEVPAVFITPGDPVAAGLVASWSRPGGNTTAMTLEYPELSESAWNF